MFLTKHRFLLILMILFFVSSQAQDWKLRRDFQPKYSRKIIKSLNCTTQFTDEIIQLIIDYAQWRNIVMLYIVDESISSGCNMKAMRRSLDCFNSNGISISIQRHFQKHVYSFHKNKRILVVSFLKAVNMNYDTYLKQINIISRSDGYYICLNIYQGYNASATMEQQAMEVLSSSEINLAFDMVIAVEMPKPASAEILAIPLCNRENQNRKTLGSEQIEVDSILPFNQSKHNSSDHGYFKEYCKLGKKFADITYCFLQVYKIRKSENSSMVICPLGNWRYQSGTDYLKPFQTVEKRQDFFGFPLIFGKKKFTQETSVADENLIEDDNDEENMDKILDFLAGDLNARAVVKTYPTLGLKGPSGNWSGLLGAVVDQEVDLALDSVIKVSERYNDMFFTHNIMVSIRNIYLRPEESHTARDIYLQPFKPELLLCVLATGVIFAIAMSMYIMAIYKMDYKKSKSHTNYTAVSEAVLWSFGVITMQGSSTVQPKSISGNIIVVVSLMFALIIYNSYSAFITSILSVKLTDIRSVDDLLQSDYDIGYTKNSQDEVFLRSMNNESQLNQIYLRGYLHNNINNVTDGLLKATLGNYGFFATGHIARKQILKISGYRCRYNLMEIPVQSTKKNVAFPTSKKSPYRKIINICLIKMAESGIHGYIGSLIEPNLPRCEKAQNYQSARINDLTTSFLLLGIGIVLGIIMVLIESFWKKKRIVYAKLRARNIGFTQGFNRDLNPGFYPNHQWVQ